MAPISGQVFVLDPVWVIMVANSVKQKKYNAYKDDCKALAEALEDWKNEQTLPEGEKKRSLTCIAREHNVARSTLYDHTNDGHRTKSEYQRTCQKLTDAQEECLVEIACTLDEGGMQCDRKELTRYAETMLNRGKRGGKITLGLRWPDGFMVRHRDRLGTRWTSPLDRARTNGLTPITKDQHFRCIEGTQKEYDIPEELDYGMDESCIMFGVGAKQRVFGRAKKVGGKRVKQSHARQDGNRETLTVVETICADGTSLKPTVIMKGKYIQKDWGGPENNPIGAQ